MVGLNNFAETVLTLVSGHRNGKLKFNIFGIYTYMYIITLLDVNQINRVLKDLLDSIYFGQKEHVIKKS